MGCRGLGCCVRRGGQGEATGRPGGGRERAGRPRPAAWAGAPPRAPMTSAHGSLGTCAGSGSGSSRAPLSSHRQYGGGGGGDTRLGRQPQGPERGYSLRCRKRKPPPNQRRAEPERVEPARPRRRWLSAAMLASSMSSGSVRAGGRPGS